MIEQKYTEIVHSDSLKNEIRIVLLISSTLGVTARSRLFYEFRVKFTDLTHCQPLHRKAIENRVNVSLTAFKSGEFVAPFDPALKLVKPIVKSNGTTGKDPT